MPIEGVVFDFDGTIVSQEIDFKKIFLEIQQLACQYKIKEPEVKLPILEYLRAVEKINKGRCDKFLVHAYDLLLKREKEASKKTQLINGVLEFLIHLKKEKILIGIVTRNSRYVVENILKKTCIPYDILVAREDVARVKPHPDHISLVIKKLNLKKSQIIVAGDHPMDVIAAKRIGVLSCGVLSGGKSQQDFIEAGADFIYSDITELAYFLGLKELPDGKLQHQLLQYLLKRYCACDRGVLVGPGIGLDAAIIKTRTKTLALKSDPITLVSKNAGAYAVKINANDIACMAAKPTWLLTTIIFPSGTKFPEIEETFREISKICLRENIAWAGGHTEISQCIRQTLICCAMVGEKIKNLRQVKNVNPGDALILVKQVGIEGASILARENKKLCEKFPAIYSKAINAIKRPGISIVKEAMIAWKTVPVIAMHDPTEGGIASGIAEIAQSIGCGFIIDERKIMFFKPAKIFCQYLGLDIYGLISSGCLLIVVPARYAENLISVYRSHKIPAAITGRAIKEKKILLMKKGNLEEMRFSATDEILKTR
ncbi:MAG: HAD-IA family hydrolase [Candidatus Omnitrophica bacterium]|nr:HAD-IA family hydrolase [Candidatus Omnitrophota bacterium]